MVSLSLARVYVEGDIIDERGRVLDYVDALLDEYYAECSMGSTLIDYPVSEQELGDISYYDELGRSVANTPNPPGTPIGKLVK